MRTIGTLAVSSKKKKSEGKGRAREQQREKEIVESLVCVFAVRLVN